MSKSQTARSFNEIASRTEIVQRGWEAVARGDWDALIADYTDGMIFVMPGQDNVLHGRTAFRSALDNIGAALPPGFAITAMRHVGEDDDVVSIIDWTSEKCPQGSQLAVLFRFEGSKVSEERWFIDTEQWKATF